MQVRGVFSVFELKMVRDAGVEPANLSVLGPKPSAFANFASRAQEKTASCLFPGVSAPFYGHLYSLVFRRLFASGTNPNW